VKSLSFDPIADRYDATRGGERRGQVLAGLLEPWLPRDGMIAEIGVGTALVAGAVAGTGRWVVGVDISAGMLAVATGRCPGRLARADAMALPFPDGALAAIYGVWVFHVFGDIQGVLAECHRVLRPGGRLVTIITDESRRISHPLLVPLERRYRRRSDAMDNLEPLALAAGFRREHVESLPAFRRPTTPTELALHLERRTWSWLWEVPDDAWAAEVAPVIVALRAEPDADTPQPHQNANLLAVWTR